MKKLYYYVPPCPVCGSRVTGQYKKLPKRQVLYEMENHLKNGEIVLFVEQVPISNAFCLKCHYTWPQIIETKIIGEKEIVQEIRARNVRPLYEAFQEKYGVKEEKHKGIIKGIVSGLFDF